MEKRVNKKIDFFKKELTKRDMNRREKQAAGFACTAARTY